jgi:hypothetical protein
MPGTPSFGLTLGFISSAITQVPKLTKRRARAACDMAGVYRLAACITNPDAADRLATAGTYKFHHAGRMTARRS